MSLLQRNSFEELYKRNRERILNFIAARVGSREDAEDITEEVFLKVYRKLPDFKWQGVNIETWIYKIARNAVIDHHRKQVKHKNNVDLDSVENTAKDENQADPLLMLLDDEDQIKLYGALSKLSPSDQYLIYYKYFEELSVSEIAIRLKLSETNVSTKLYRLRKRILELINSKTKHEKHSAKTEK
jgi:RNA polymerase sigma-70 factor (ECF subfamily)